MELYDLSFSDSVSDGSAWIIYEIHSVKHKILKEEIYLEEKTKFNSFYEEQAVIVEGPDIGIDNSFFLCHMCEDIANLEWGISVSNFLEESKLRNIDMEFWILLRICNTSDHFRQLFRSEEVNFRARNRYFDILPYSHSLVKCVDKN